MTREETRFETIIGRLLRYGVILSFCLVALGAVLLFLEGQTGYSSLESTQSLVDTRSVSLIGFGPLASGLEAARPYSIIELGLLVLLGTPVARVAVSIPLFLEERRYAFVAITGTVLTVLLLSIFVVAPLVAA